jgi:SAM-dependent methyltransferase
MGGQISDGRLTAANKARYDHKYSNAQIESIISIVSRGIEFIEEAILNHTSWRGLYHGGLQHRLRGARVLELGSGDCTNALLMAKLGAEVVATDLSDASPQIARTVAARLNIPIEAHSGDLLLLASQMESRTFDFVIGKAFVHHLTNSEERDCYSAVAELIRPSGEVRWFEPAVNSPLLDAIRWAIPVPGRPSSLDRRRFREFREMDVHPVRDNSSDSYRRIGGEFFGEIEVYPIGALERFGRLMPNRYRQSYRRTAFRAEEAIPVALHEWAARSQTVVMRAPRAVDFDRPALSGRE